MKGRKKKYDPFTKTSTGHVYNFSYSNGIVFGSLNPFIITIISIIIIAIG